MILNIQYIDLKFQFTLPKIGLPKINTLSPPMVSGTQAACHHWRRWRVASRRTCGPARDSTPESLRSMRQWSSSRDGTRGAGPRPPHETRSACRHATRARRSPIVHSRLTL